MRKIRIVLLLSLFSIIRLMAAPCGDVNSSGEIDIIDALMTAQFYVGLNPQGFDQAAAEVSGDGFVDIVDALQLAQYYVGLITTFPGCTVSPTTQPGTSVTYALQAETDAIWNNAAVESDHAGYTGSGYVNTANASGVWIEWTVNVPAAGNAECAFRFAAESGIRSMDLIVNGSVVTGLDFPASGAWTSWSIKTVTVNLNAGSNTIRLTAITGNGAPNMDKLDLTTGSSGFTPVPTQPPTPAPTGQTPGPTAPPNSGIIRINDPVTGWADMDGGTTGGGTDLSRAVTVTSMSQLQSAASGTDKKIILVEPGTYTGALLIGANKTIIGTAPGVTIEGYIQMRADKKDAAGNLETHNIIIRNIAVKGDYCSEMRECRDGPDAVYIGQSTHHVWLDHMDIYDGQDGNLDITEQGDFVTSSWCKFRYSYDKPHRFSNLIAGSDDKTYNRGKLKITYMYCWWGDRVEERMPRGRYGQVHCFNNYYSTRETAENVYCIGPGREMRIIVENSDFDVADIPAVKVWGEPTGWRLTGNIGNAREVNQEWGTLFTIPYPYNLIPATMVKATVTASVGGAGNTCTFRR